MQYCSKTKRESLILHSAPQILRKVTVLLMQGYLVVVLGVHMFLMANIISKWTLEDYIFSLIS